MKTTQCQTTTAVVKTQNMIIDPSSDPYGGRGCKADGIDGCIFCGLGNMPDCV